jgi:hypothetical protein
VSSSATAFGGDGGFSDDSFSGNGGAGGSGTAAATGNSETGTSLFRALRTAARAATVARAAPLPPLVWRHPFLAMRPQAQMRAPAPEVTPLAAPQARAGTPQLAAARFLAVLATLLRGQMRPGGQAELLSMELAAMAAGRVRRAWRLRLGWAQHHRKQWQPVATAAARRFPPGTSGEKEATPMRTAQRRLVGPQRHQPVR